eukprot:COSAG01_NODE_8140_length_2902_cov_56.215889_6_plen_166_part_00
MSFLAGIVSRSMGLYSCTGDRCPAAARRYYSRTAVLCCTVRPYTVVLQIPMDPPESASAAYGGRPPLRRPPPLPCLSVYHHGQDRGEAHPPSLPHYLFGGGIIPAPVLSDSPRGYEGLDPLLGCTTVLQSYHAWESLARALSSPMVVPPVRSKSGSMQQQELIPG